MLVRIILLAVIIALVMSMIRKWKAQQDGQAADTTTPVMKKCAQCGVHLPQQDAIHSGDLYFCSEAHRQTYAKQHQSH